MDDEIKYILQARDGDFVSAVVSGGTETVKLHFEFTKIKGRAKKFTLHELIDPKATVSVGGEFQKGFAGGKLIQVSPF